MADETSKLVSPEVAQQMEEMRTEQEEQQAELFELWGEHVGRNVALKNEVNFDNIRDWMTMVSDEMKNTNFLNSTGFAGYSDFNWEGLLDEEMQEFVMHYGEGDNNNAYMFVEQMRVITLKKMEDAEVGDEESSKGT